MSPVTHFLLGWLTANVDGFNRRERAAITLSGVAPDIDGLGIVPELLTRNSAHPLNWFSEYHHLLGHNLAFGVFVTAVSVLAAGKRLKTALFVLLSFRLHLLCDMLGARGPDAEQWPIPYFFPFSRAWQLSWSGQWALNALPKLSDYILCAGRTFYLAWKRGYSPVEMFSHKSDTAFVDALRQRFGRAKPLRRHA